MTTILRARAAFSLALLVGAVACDAFTPAIDPAPYPCHNPRMHYCHAPASAGGGGGACCWDGEVCLESPPRCEYVGPLGAARDAGADAR